MVAYLTLRIDPARPWSLFRRAVLAPFSWTVTRFLRRLRATAGVVDSYTDSHLPQTTFTVLLMFLTIFAYLFFHVPAFTRFHTKSSQLVHVFNGYYHSSNERHLILQILHRLQVAVPPRLAWDLRNTLELDKSSERQRSNANACSRRNRNTFKELQ